MQLRQRANVCHRKVAINYVGFFKNDNIVCSKRVSVLDMSRDREVINTGFLFFATSRTPLNMASTSRWVAAERKSFL